MTSLKFQLEDPFDDGVTEKAFPLLQNFLQPNSSLGLKTTARKILELLPDHEDQSMEVRNFGDLCIELAEQIPYHHSSQMKLVKLMEEMGKFSQLGSVYSSEVSPRRAQVFQIGSDIDDFQKGKAGRYIRYQLLGERMRDCLVGPDPDDPSQYVNYHAFAAHLWEHRIFSTDPTWAIWAQRDALEGRVDVEDDEQDAYVLAAAQWILWYGQSFFKQVMYPGDVTPNDLRGWSPGPLYDGKAALNLHRWHFWRDSYREIACSVDEGYSAECKNVSARVVEIMDSLERIMMF
ncbi:MAG: hypothetical protein M1817_000994 [Caeruleum heppii]|nr:MAG: hypothetical protein M1817_000994 [Caeruleum heppii]